MILFKNIFSVTLLFINLCAWSQKEASQWHFGYKTSLDFLQNPPVIGSSSIVATGSGSSIADSTGNLLFYTSGLTVWNAAHDTMANGLGLLGFPGGGGVFVIKQPLSANIYYVFTIAGNGGVNGLRYSVVDMSLAAGMGSVTVKNALLHTPSTDHMAATLHCNQRDVWIVTHDWQSSNFRAFLLTPSGINTAALAVSNIGPSFSGTDIWFTKGVLKIAPNSKKIAITNFGLSYIGLADFDASNGLLSNFMYLDTNIAGTNGRVIGCEFSPDGSKLYATIQTAQLVGSVLQWDLCAGTLSQIEASKTTLITIAQAGSFHGLQLGIDGKIYIAQAVLANLAVINNPNSAGLSCNLVNAAINTTPPQIVSALLPPFVSNFFKPKPANYTYTFNCQEVLFSSPDLTNDTLNTHCAANTYSLNSRQWNFGDPASGSANTSTLTNPAHFYSSPGTYTAALYVNYSCGTDTLRQIVTVMQSSPFVTITGDTAICKGEQIILTASGSYSFNWNTGSTNSSITINPNNTSTYTLTALDTSGCSLTKTVSVLVANCTGFSKAANNRIFRVYPNPAQAKLIIESAEASVFDLQDISGRVLLHGQSEKGITTLNISMYNSGVYFLTIANKETSTTYKVLKTE